MSLRIILKLGLRLVLLLVTLVSISWLVMQENYLITAALIVIVLLQIVEWIRFQTRTYRELAQFIESVRYKDYSRHFNIAVAPAEVKELRKAFNQIIDAFKASNKEKEMQYQYLQKILEMVNTGILSYETSTGEIIWMNESLKQLLKLPYLKSIHSLQKRDESLYHQIIALKPGTGSMARYRAEKEEINMLISASGFHSEGKTYKLTAFQNINEAVNETETKAWQKLLSVMTHEIMNSVAPISSLAGTLQNTLETAKTKIDDDKSLIDDLSVGIDTIKKRSEGLLRFAETYRNLNKLSKPDLQTIYIRDLFENICTLMQPTFSKNRIEIDIILKDTGLKADLDPSLIEQVLINLVINAVEAVKDREEKAISLSAEKSQAGKIVIKVSDNGSGMEQAVLEQIFIPFFTTKKTGSGIGLSLCKQIMTLHKGNISVQSSLGEGTIFTLQFA